MPFPERKSCRLSVGGTAVLANPLQSFELVQSASKSRSRLALYLKMRSTLGISGTLEDLLPISSRHKEESHVQLTIRRVPQRQQESGSIPEPHRWVRPCARAQRCNGWAFPPRQSLVRRQPESLWNVLKVDYRIEYGQREFPEFLAHREVAKLCGRRRDHLTG